MLVVKFDFYTGVRAAPATYFLISSVLFFGIYLVYFIITYIGFCRNVEEWGVRKGWGENEEKRIVRFIVISFRSYMLSLYISCGN